MLSTHDVLQGRQENEGKLCASVRAAVVVISECLGPRNNRNYHDPCGTT